jgi:serine protease Do
MSVLEELGTAATAALAKVGPSVVRIGRGGGRGCGVVFGDGLVATNAHNLRGEEALVTFAGGRQAVGTVAALDVDGDLAVLRVDTADAPPVTMAVSGQTATTGQVVFAVARSATGGERVSFGLVSGTERAFRGPRGRRIKGSLEHTAPLPRGSSGGPLVDPEGRLLGLNAVRMDGGLIVAIPTDAALRERVEALARGEAPARPRLGLAIAPAHVARRLRMAVGLPEREGLLVRWVEDGGAAERAGIQKGDLIVAAAGEPVASVDDLQPRLEAAANGELVLTVVRGADEREVAVALDPVEA